MKTKTIKQILMMVLVLASTLNANAQTAIIVKTDIETDTVNLATQKNYGDTMDVHYCSNTDSISISYANGDSIQINRLTKIGSSTYSSIYAKSNVKIFDDSTVKYTFFVHIFKTNNNSINETFRFLPVLPTGNVCWVTVDSSSNHNIIVWDTTGTSKEGIQSMILTFWNGSMYQPIDTELYSDSNHFFVDYVNVPDFTPVTYKIFSVNSCGNMEDSTSTRSQTSMQLSDNGNGNFTISAYLIENLKQPVIRYYLYRNDTLVHYVPGTSATSYQLHDAAYSSTAKYYVGAKINTDLCYLSPVALGKKPLMINDSISRSNVLINGKPAGINTINDNVNVAPVSAYPNPFTNTINVVVNKHSVVELMDITGRVVLTTTAESGHNAIEVTLPDGMYFLRVNGTTVEKIVK